MYYRLLDKLECACGGREFRVAAPVTRKAAPGPVFLSVQCRHFCARKNRLVASNGLKPADCTECSGLELMGGRISCSCGRTWQVRDGRPDFNTKRVGGDESGKLEVIETDFATDPRWNPFIRSHPRGLIYHHSLWLSALRDEYGQEALSLACVNAKGEFEGLFPLLYTRGLPGGLSRVGGQVTGRRLSSLPRTPVAGPLGTSRAVDELLLREAVRRVKGMPGTMLQVKVDTADLDGIVDGMEGTFWRNSYVLDLPRPGESIRFGNSREHHKVAWAANKAVRMGIMLRQGEDEENLARWYRLYLETMRRVVALPRPYRFFQTLWRILRPRGMMRLLLAEVAGSDGNQLVAGTILLAYGSTLHYAFTGCNGPALALHANDLLQWETIHSASKKGFRYYDFGEVDAECPDLARFKAKWLAKAVPLYRYYYPSPDSPDARAMAEPSHSHWVREIWQRLPLDLTRVVGGQIFRRL